MNARCLFLSLFATLALLATSHAQSSAPAVFQIEFTHPATIPAHWTMTIHPDGTGHFTSERGNASIANQRAIVAPDIDRDIQLSKSLTDNIFETAQQQRLFTNCESRTKVAFQGWKLFSYSGQQGQWSCKFNYASTKEMQSLSSHLVNTAFTILEGAILESHLQHDRLGLDTTTDDLADAIKDDRAEQLGTIQAILQRLVDDPNLLARVRKRAQTLLDIANTEK